MANEQACYTVVQDDGSEVPSTQELRSALEKGSDELKIETLRKIIITTLNGNDQVKSMFPQGHCSPSNPIDTCVLGKTHQTSNTRNACHGIFVSMHGAPHTPSGISSTVFALDCSRACAYA